MFNGKISDLNTFRMGQNMTFLQPFTYKEIHLGIIYIATDYSMYKARTGSKLKLTGALYVEENYTVDVNSAKKARGDLADRHFNSAWKLSPNKDWTLLTATDKAAVGS